MGPFLGTTTFGQSGPKSNGNEGVLHMPQDSRTEASPLEQFSFISTTVIWWVGSYLSVEMQLIYFTDPVNRAHNKQTVIIIIIITNILIRSINYVNAHTILWSRILCWVAKKLLFFCLANKWKLSWLQQFFIVYTHFLKLFSLKQCFTYITWK